MMVIGIDAHKRSHTAVTVDERGRQGAVGDVGAYDGDGAEPIAILLHYHQHHVVVRAVTLI
jgi:hypothetical protein